MRIDRWAAVAALAAVMSQGCNDLTVRAISRFAGGPVPGVQVQIDDGPWVETDANGRVALSRPGKSFVLRVHQADPPFAFSERVDRLWVYVDPEDREPESPARPVVQPEPSASASPVASAVMPVPPPPGSAITLPPALKMARPVPPAKTEIDDSQDA